MSKDILLDRQFDHDYHLLFIHWHGSYLFFYFYSRGISHAAILTIQSQ